MYAKVFLFTSRSDFQRCSRHEQGLISAQSALGTSQQSRAKQGIEAKRTEPAQHILIEIVARRASSPHGRVIPTLLGKHKLCNYTSTCTIYAPNIRGWGSTVLGMGIAWGGVRRSTGLGMWIVWGGVRGATGLGMGIVWGGWCRGIRRGVEVAYPPLPNGDHFTLRISDEVM